MNAESHVVQDPQIRRRVRRAAIGLGVLALAIYVSYVVFLVTHGHR